MSTKTWILAKFEHEQQLVTAAGKLKSLGYDKLDGFAPYDSHAVQEAVGVKKSIIPWLVFFGGLTGFLFGGFLMYYCNVYDWPINIGGRTMASYPTYVPICFECTILFSVLTSIGSVFFLSGLPMPYHPFFASEGFQKASTDAFILGVYLPDPSTTHTTAVADELEKLGARSVEQVEE